LVETFQLLHKKSKMGILIISHQERIMKLADEIIIMNQGRIVKSGNRDAILPELSSEFDASCEFRK
ncbi:MAG: ABC transporter ATP-binding protein, partial [Erysipelotrichaceae bacterium]